MAIALEHPTSQRRPVLHVAPRCPYRAARRQRQDIGRALVLILVGLVCGYALGVMDAARKPAQAARVRAAR